MKENLDLPGRERKESLMIRVLGIDPILESIGIIVPSA